MPAARSRRTAAGIVIGAETPQDWDTETGETVDGENVLQFNKEMHSGQLRIAERFVNAYSNRLLYVHGIGWHYWAGTHWMEDKDGKVRRRVISLLKEVRHEAVDLQAKPRDALLADVKRCESSGGVTGVLELAKHMHPMTVAAEEINADPGLFNARNGTMNLETGKLQRHNPRNMITKCAGTAIDPNAHSELFDTFLSEVLPDEDVRGYLQRVLGVSMLGMVREHIMPILTGVGGNGKSVCIEAVLAAFGDYGLTVDPKLIVRTKHERHATFLADLHGARLVVTSETDEGDVLAAATVKRLTGGDKIRANRMRENPFEFTPSHSLVYVTNFRPKVNGDDKAMWRRLTVVPFDVVVAEPDVTLPEKIKGQLPAVLAWVYQGWREYQRQGLNPPLAVLDRTENYRSENDPLSQFLAEQCVFGNPLMKVKAKSLYEAWAVWAMKQGQPAITNVDFGRRVSERFEKKHSSGGVQYVGLALRSDEDDQAGLL